MKKVLRPLAVLVACSTVSLASAQISARQKHEKHTTASVHSSSAASVLKQDMRKLWTDHVVWTRDYVIAAVGGQPDAQAAAARL